ncbi:sensor histidine kinase [Pontibacter pamirensis]|uniref:sensor histidine kinase n=1 Tax=Pontibacter pamirensis TaxID=2562824 RepID=UPI0013898C2D|nr:histidine kinase [Pontibacter pamirensis]
MPTKLPLRVILVHALAWAVFILYEVTMALVQNSAKTMWWEYGGYYLINISLFYLHAHLVMDDALEKEWLPALLVILVPLELGWYVASEHLLEKLLNLYRSVPEEIVLDTSFFLRHIWQGASFISVSTAYWMVLNIIKRNKVISQLKVQQAEAEREKAELEKDLALSQNAYLRAQINPHMLFNTLSFIYSTVQDVSPKASEGVLLLSEVMHYALGQVHEDGKIDLAREVEQVKKYIGLNQLRFSKPLQLQMSFEGGFSQHRLPPLLLLTFVENMFKHGILNDPAHPATVFITCTDTTLNLSTRNKKRKSVMKGHGIGIQNVETRLRKLYGEGYFLLNIQQDDVYYETNLQLVLA